MLTQDMWEQGLCVLGRWGCDSAIFEVPAAAKDPRTLAPPCSRGSGGTFQSFQLEVPLGGDTEEHWVPPQEALGPSSEEISAG